MIARIDSDWPTFHDLLVAYRCCRLGKPANVSQIRFETRLAENLAALGKEIHSDRYKPAPAKCFIVTRPKPREIFAADFRDRVVHHLVVSQLEPAWERRFVHASFACRVGKGAHGAIRHIQQQVRRLSRGGKTAVWALQVDIEKFFVSINRPVLRDLLIKHVRQPRLRAMVQTIYTHDARVSAKKGGYPSLFELIPEGKSWFDQGPDEGLPIGNLTSQFGANVYLTALDQLVERRLKPGAYLRYMDDLTLLDTDPDKLRGMIEPIDSWLQRERRQRLNAAKTSLRRLSDGISYLGYRLCQTDSPAQPLQVFLEPLKKWEAVTAIRELERAEMPFAERPHPLAPVLRNRGIIDLLTSCNARIGNLHHAKSYRFRKKSMDRLIEATGGARLPKGLHDPWSPYKIKRDYRAIQLR